MSARLVVLARRKPGTPAGIVVLESAVASLGASAALAVVLDPVIRGALAGQSAFASAIAVAYPLFELILLAVMAGIAAAPTVNVGPRWWSLAVGLGIFAVADIAYALLEHEGSNICGADEVGGAVADPRELR